MPESKRRKPKQQSRTRPSAASVLKTRPPSPTWYVILMAGLMILGVMTVIARFVFLEENWVTLAGLGLIAAGFLMTTNYR